MRRRVSPVLWMFAAAVAMLGSPAGHAQTPARIAPAVYGNLHWRFIGPEGNRFSTAAGIPGDPATYYVGAASGGIYKTTDGGVNWTSLFDAQPVQSMGALAVDPSDPNTIWAGTGEAHIRSHISVGQGIYKSQDAGKSWTLMGLEQTGRIARVVVHPKDSNVVLVCALGHAYGPQPERGVFRTTDGGVTWTRTLFADENTGCSDLAMDPSNPRILFAGMWSIEIHTWGRTSGGPGGGLFTSRDGGVTWRKLTGNGLPTKPVGKVALAISRSNPNRVYAMIETGDGVPLDGSPTEAGQVWRSEDGGGTWRIVTYDRNAMGRAHYYSRIVVAPDDEDEVYFLTASYAKSIDGAQTLVTQQRAQAPGGDHHDLWIDPTNPNRQIVAHDQGLSITINRGRTWFRQRLTNAQIYHVTVDNEIPYNVLGNKQDEPSYRGPSNSRLGGGFGGDPGIPRGMWHSVGGGESGWATPDPTNSKLIWSTASGSGMVGGIVVRFDENRRQLRNVEVWPYQQNGPPAEPEVPLRVGRAAPHLAPRPQHHLRGQPAPASHHQRRAELGRDQPRPDAQRQDAAEELRRPHARQHRRRVHRRGLRHRRIPARTRSHLGGHQRRPRAGDARRRQVVDQRDQEPARPAALGQRAQHRALEVRRGHGVSHRGLPPGEQPRSVHLQDHRLRPHLEGDHRRHSQEHAQLRQGDLRRSRAPRPALRGHRERHLRVVRRRRELAAAADGSAARAGVGHRGAAALQRPGDLHLRARLLHPRRHHAIAAAHAAGAGRRRPSVPAAGRLSLPADHRALDHLRRSHRGRESALRRVDQLPLEERALGARHRHHPRRQESGGAHVGRHGARGSQSHLLGSTRRAHHRNAPTHESALRAPAAVPSGP